MTALENFDLLVTGKEPRWIPFTLDVGARNGLSSAVRERFKDETGWSDAAEYFDYDFRIKSIRVSWPEQERPPLKDAREVSQIEDYPLPVLESRGVADDVHELHLRGYPVVGFAGSMTGWAERLRGLRMLASDAAERPALAEAIVERIAGFTRALAESSAAAGIDVLAFSDDAPISPELWRSLIKPAWKSVLKAVSTRHPRAVFFLHTSGEIGEIVPDLVEIGFKIVHASGPNTDIRTMKRQWGDRLVVCATVQAGETLRSASAQDVRLSTSRLMDLLGDDRRCIICPSAAIGPDTPWENVLAFTCAARNHPHGKKGVMREA